MNYPSCDFCGSCRHCPAHDCTCDDIDLRTPRNLHIGRSWDGPGHLEETCPCPKAPCGLVDTYNTAPECLQHPYGRFKTMRSGHTPDKCPGPPCPYTFAHTRHWCGYATCRDS
jgi:hypothetical protein